jgi:hypothetical protein
MTTPNVRYALRSLIKTPIFSIVAVLSLGLALAVNTTVFALIDAVTNPTLPYHGADRVYSVRAAVEPRNASTLEERYAALRSGFHSADLIVPYFRRRQPSNWETRLKTSLSPTCRRSCSISSA